MRLLSFFSALIGSTVLFLSYFCSISPAYAATILSQSTNLADYPNSKIPQYEKLEVTLTLGSSYTNPYNPDEIKVDGYFTSPTKQVTQPGFFYQNYTVSGIGTSETYTASGSPVWKVRFTPKETGTYQYFIRATDQNGTVNSSTGSFEVISSADKGFIHVSAKNNRYFEYDSGSPFIGLGLNVSWWQDENRRITNYQYYLDRMGEYKANLARVWMTNSGKDQTWILSIQDKNLGSNYNQSEAWALDYILNQAEQKGIAFLLTMDDVNQYGSNWDVNLYNTAMGGPCSYPSCIFTNATAKKNQKQIIRYLVARWGYSTSLLSWELFNEINEMEWITSNWNWQDVINWHQEMAQYIHSIDAHSHMVNTSTGSFKTYTELYSGVPEMAFSQMHFYYVPGWQWAISDPAGQDMANLMRYYAFQLYSSVSGKPGIIGEWGVLNSGWTDSSELNNDDKGVHLHNGLWSSLMSGLASSGLSWHWGYHKTHDVKWWQHYKALSNYFDGIDITNLTPLKPANVNFTFPAPAGGSAPDPYPDNRSTTLTSSNAKLRVLGLKNTANAYLWIQNVDNTWWNYVRGTTHANQSGTVAVYGLSPSTNYTVEWWDSYAGTVTGTQSMLSGADGTLQLTITGLSTDLAAKVVKTGGVPSVTPTPYPSLSQILRNYGSTLSQYDLDRSGKVNIIDAIISLVNAL